MTHLTPLQLVAIHLRLVEVDYIGVRGVMTSTLYSLLTLLKIQMKHYV